MKAEKTISDIARLEQLYALPDERPLPASATRAAYRMPDAIYVRNLGLRLLMLVQCLSAMWHIHSRPAQSGATGNREAQ